MGKYIDRLDKDTMLLPKQKAGQLLQGVPGTLELDGPPSELIPDLVCVVENGYFDAAAWIYDERELRDFAEPDGRRRRWLIVPGAEDLVKLGWY